MNVIRFTDLVAQGRAAGRRVFVRADLNVPQDDAGRITDDTRIRASVPCLRLALDAGAAVMVTSHLGRPTEGTLAPDDTLAPVAARLGELLGREVPLIADWTGGRRGRAGPAGDARELPRQQGREEERRGAVAQDGGAVRHLRQRRLRHRAPRRGVDARHRAYAPVACAGPLLAAEIDAITQALAAPKRPLVAIVAGSKVSTKLTILKALADKVDRLIVGGGIANTFLLAAGLPIGRSLAEADLVGEARAVIDAMAARGSEVPIPTDVVTAKRFAADAEAVVKPAAEVADDDLILDIGPDTAARLADGLKSAGTIVWNGPVGVFEFEAFSHGTETIARAIAASPAFSIAGGGDTLAAIAKYGIEGEVGYISTGGGAFLEILEGKTLPALAVLEERAAAAAA